MRKYLLLPLALQLVGCATIDFDYPRSPSYYLPETSNTYLGRQVSPVVAEQEPGQSGFYPMSDGVDALALRLLLAARAEKSIDVQYYLIKDDIVGRAFVLSLLRAADRGVRVRLLLDDMFTSGYDVGLAALYSHPNFEIRIFNPFHRGMGGAAKSAVSGFRRINRRMHNKSFTVDNQITIIGGRNIAGEYFGAREDAKFGDLDVTAIGPVVQDVSDMFDTYWNHQTALPVPAFVDELENAAEQLNQLRSQLEANQREISSSRYAAAVGQTIERYLESEDNEFVWSTYQLVVDSPDKGVVSKSATAPSITTPLIESLQSAEQELLIVSPYFVPLKQGIEDLIELQKSGIHVRIVTNSLAANNQFAVHGGYAPARRPLLESGIRIYEVRPDAEVRGTEFVDATGARATLHTKAFVVDRNDVFVGSFNFDPRSANLNTELGVIIHAPALAVEFLEAFDTSAHEKVYEVFLNDKGKLRWRTMIDGKEVIYDKEPETTWGQRFMAGFVGLLPIKSQL